MLIKVDRINSIYFYFVFKITDTIKILKYYKFIFQEKITVLLYFNYKKINQQGSLTFNQILIGKNVQF